MISNLRFFKSEGWKGLKDKITLKKVPAITYSQYYNVEYSRYRLTHDMFDNYYFRDPSPTFNGFAYDSLSETHKARSR